MKPARYEVVFAIPILYDEDGKFVKIGDPGDEGLFSDAEDGVWDVVEQEWVDCPDFVLNTSEHLDQALATYKFAKGPT
jgi:hypothetical protein